LNYNKKKEIN